jgi:hypothetical protein
LATLSAPYSALAQSQSITCFNKAGDTAQIVEFDEAKQTARMDGMLMSEVKITKRHIRFIHDLGSTSGAWPISIDRVTGVMEIKIPGKDEPGIPTHLAPRKCEKTIQKF